MPSHESYMQRCLELARYGAGQVAPNPLVGAVLVHGDRIIGEGWHRQFGGPHAEVHCIRDAIHRGQEALLPESTLYVSLEPCAHTGKTPPCADLIIRHKIPRVVIACRDPFEAVNGKGMEKLEQAGVEVIPAVLEAEAVELNKRFFCFHLFKRPYIILKWAETADGYIGKPGERLLISHATTNRLVHRWRSEETAILVGTETALQDDPQLNNRLWPGPSPVRLVLDMQLRLPSSLRLFQDGQKTVVFNALKQEEEGPVQYQQIRKGEPVLPQLLDLLYQWQWQSVLVEGGAKLLQTCINAGSWDEIRIIRSAQPAGSGIASPLVELPRPVAVTEMAGDTISFYRNPRQQFRLLAHPS